MEDSGYIKISKETVWSRMGMLADRLVNGQEGRMKSKKPFRYSERLLFGRDDWIRTSGPYVPNVVRYRAALHPANRVQIYPIFIFRVHG